MATSSLELLAPAKLNLHLGIYPGRDERGYHRADSVMIGVALADSVQIAPADSLVLTTSVDCGVPQQRNTAFRAARELCRAFGRDEGYAIHITKRVPSQAGMGGASSDAASVLLGLCKLWDVDPLDERAVARLEQRLGCEGVIDGCVERFAHRAAHPRHLLSNI